MDVTAYIFGEINEFPSSLTNIVKIQEFPNKEFTKSYTNNFKKKSINISTQSNISTCVEINENKIIKNIFPAFNTTILEINEESHEIIFSNLPIKYAYNDKIQVKDFQKNDNVKIAIDKTDNGIFSVIRMEKVEKNFNILADSIPLDEYQNALKNDELQLYVSNLEEDILPSSITEYDSLCSIRAHNIASKLFKNKIHCLKVFVLGNDQIKVIDKTCIYHVAVCIKLGNSSNFELKVIDPYISKELINFNDWYRALNFDNPKGIQQCDLILPVFKQPSNAQVLNLERTFKLYEIAPLSSPELEHILALKKIKTFLMENDILANVD